MNKYERTKLQLDNLYRYQMLGNFFPEDETFGSIKSDNDDVSCTYGEVTRKGVDDIIDALGDYINQDTVMYDLGSGYGTLVFHLCIKKEIKTAVGIEYFSKRCNYALQQVEKWKYKSSSPPEFICGNYFNLDISKANIVYWDNIMFYDNIDAKKKILSKLSKNCVLIVRSKLDLDDCEWQQIESSTTYKEKCLAYYTIKN